MNAYHVTLKKSLPNILARGLQPRIGPRAKELGETDHAIYLYKTKKDCKDGLKGWFGGCFFGADANELVVVEVQLAKGGVFKSDGNGEIISLEWIAVGDIKKIYDKDIKKDITDQFEPADITPPQEEDDEEDDDDDFF